ncbi:MAG: hypothetical protein K0S47_20 [Herbinix sp.]|jgi:flagellar hook-associated protein 2|nr:hypothetical protein [Herbinix sp.]
MVQAYNHMIETYNAKNEIRYHAHKRGELKRIYSSIVNTSKQTPVYKINLSNESQVYALGIKEAALNIKNKLEEITDPPEESIFMSKSVYVSDEEVLSAKLLTDDTKQLPEMLTMKLHNLASNQVNKGKELYRDLSGLSVGVYAFRIYLKDQSHNLSYEVKKRVNNLENQNQIAQIINKADLGIIASVENHGRNFNSIKLEADFPGNFGERSFTLEDIGEQDTGVVEYLGLNRLHAAGKGALFDLNNTHKVAYTNTFSIDNILQISLKKASEDPVEIKLVPDGNKILNHIEKVADTYNELVNVAKARTEETLEHNRALKLLKELQGLSKVYHNELEACGISISEEGRMQVDETLAYQAAADGGMESLFQRKNGFIARLTEKAASIAINPMEYLDQTIVTYPNHRQLGFTNPYVTSIYSGMLFNSYC